MKSGLAALLARLRALDLELRDAFWLSGLSAAGYGIWQIYPPAAWIAVGAALFWLGTRRGV